MLEKNRVLDKIILHFSFCLLPRNRSSGIARHIAGSAPGRSGTGDIHPADSHSQDISSEGQNSPVLLRVESASRSAVPWLPPVGSVRVAASY